MKSVGSLWFAARSFGVQLHDNDPACKQGCARRQLLCVGRCAQKHAMSVHFFVIEGNFWYESVLVDNGNAFFAVSCKLSCRSCTLVWVRDSHWQTMATSPNKEVCRDVLALMDRVSPVNGLGPCHCWHPERDLAKCVDTHGSLQRHTLGDAVQSGFKGFHTGWRLNSCRRAEQHGGPPRFYEDPSLAEVPYQCHESRSPSIQTVMRYTWNRCGISCDLGPVRSHDLNP